jgi:hypothetical protein
VRQKDVIGEWLPKAWPGISDVHWGKRKWLMGLRWEQIDVDLILKHRLSKSVRGRNNVMNPDIGTVKGWDLKAYPMIMEELARLCGGVVDRSALPTSGPGDHLRRHRPAVDAIALPAHVARGGDSSRYPGGDPKQG